MSVREYELRILLTHSNGLHVHFMVFELSEGSQYLFRALFKNRMSIPITPSPREEFRDPSSGLGGIWSKLQALAKGGKGEAPFTLCFCPKCTELESG